MIYIATIVFGGSILYFAILEFILLLFNIRNNRQEKNYYRNKAEQNEIELAANTKAIAALSEKIDELKNRYGK